ncbi:hypothetical protein A4S06_05015 [Erysipelotrichaceae bacterium MTC7]|nr:hypothetical protein A4S06_05015 [Erysipelotrichaceae bacterium MTC7]
MRKKSLLCLLAMLLLVSCKVHNEVSSQAMELYNAYKERIIANAQNGSDSYDIPFAFAFEITPLEDHAVSYSVIIDEPKVLMNQVQMMALDPASVAPDKMEPSIGIFEEESYGLIPNQVDASRGYPKGLAINGESSTNTFDLYVMVTYIDENQSNVRVFFSTAIINGKVFYQEVEHE